MVQDELCETKRPMGALVRMKPRPQEEMKVGSKKLKKSSHKKRTKNKP